MKKAILAISIGMAGLSATPASAQLFWLPPDFSAPVATGLEAGLGTTLPGATDVEQRAAIAWNMRSGLNVAALQCGFAPTLRTLENYNGILKNHNAELSAAFNTLSQYFKRTAKTPQLGQKALDSFGTKTYTSFSAVDSQLEFCNTAGRVGTSGLFTPRGSFTTFAMERVRELRGAMVRKGEQQFKRPVATPVYVPSMSEKCWKRGKYVCP
jgi:hypothetical protein